MINEDTIDFLVGSQRAADTNPVFAVDDDPERAARALDLGATTGVDPSIVYGDLDGFERQARVALTQDIISGNPHLQSYVAGSPMAAKVSNDDYGNLDAVTQAIEPLSRESSLGAIGKIAKAVKEGFNYEGLNEEYKRLYNYVDNPVWRAFVGNQIFGAAIMTPVLGLAAGTAAFHGAAATAEQGYLALGGSPAWGARFGRDVLAGLQVGLAGQGETIPAAQAEAFNRSVRPYTAAGKEPPLGVSPGLDQMKAKEAEAGAAALEEAVASAQTSLTRERAPDMFADYIRQHTDESIGVPIDAVLELYGGKEPGPNDGLLGFTPRLREQMQLAMETGGDVQIPIADFLAKVDPAVAKALRDHVRLKPEGVTVEEGKALSQPAAAEAPVDTVRNAAKLGPLLEEPTAERPFVSPPGWMPKAQYDRYLRLIEKRQTEDLAIAERRAAEAVRQRESVEWKAKRLEVQKEVAQDFQQSREFAADEYFRDGLLYGEKIERLKLGEEFLSDEMKEVLPKSFVVKDGINPDEVAGFFGYPDGQSMVYALGQLHQERLASGMNAPAFRRAALEAEIDRRMEERYGSFSEKVLEEAKEQALSETQLQLLHEDTLALAEKNGLQYPMTREQFDRTVVGRFSDALVKEVSSDKFLRDAGKAGRAVEDALLKGDFQEAFRQRQRQYVASAMAKEALKFEKASDQVDKLAKRFAPREVSGVEQEYADFVQLLLRQAGFNGKKSLSEIADSIAFHGNESLPEFVQKVKGDGWEPEVAGWLGVTPKAKDAMTVGEFGEFKDALDSLAHIGREVRKIEIKGQKEDWVEWRQGVLDHIRQLPKRTRESLDKGGRWFYRMDASLTRMEEIIKDLDLREELGPLYQAVIAPMVRSKAKEFDLLTETARYFKDVRGQFGKEWRKTLADTIPNDLIIDPHTNTPYDLSRENLIQIMLNWGTRSNIEKFTQGAASVKLGRKATKEEAAALEDAVKAMIDKHATKEDWDFVKAMWEPFRKYQPEADTVSRNVSGVAPKWIPGEAIETPFGTVDGAYWPVKYDRLGSNLAVIEDRSGADALFNTQYFRAATSKNYLKERTGYVDFLDINNSIESAAGVLQQMIHDISFRDALVQANRVFGDKQIRGAIRGHYGVEYEAQLIPWLKRIAHKNSGDQVAVKWWNDWMRRARVNTIGHVLPLNFKVILSPDVGYPSLSAWSDYIVNRTTYNATAKEKSNEIRHMIYNMDRDFREQMEAAARGGKYSTFQRDAVSWAFGPMMKFSQEFRVSTFMEKYNKAKGEGLSDSEAAQLADSYVRERHGAASTVDLPAIMESTESMKILTMFYGYFNTMYNWQRQLPGNLRRREWDKFAVNSIGSVIVPAAFGAALFNQYKENDSWFKIIGKALLLQPLSTIPIVRDFANWWFEGFSPRAPAFGIFQSISSLYTDIQRATEGRQMKKPVQNTANVIGLSTGLPLAQIGRTGEFAHDVYTGEQRPKNIAEWWRGIVTGESKLKKGK